MCRFVKFHFYIVNRNSEYWAQVPQSKNSTRGISEGGDHFYHFQQVKLCRFVKFHFYIVNRNSEYWAQVPQSKNSTRGISEGGDHFYHFQQVKLCRFAKFLFCIVNRNRFTMLLYSEYWAQVPQSKNSTRGISEGGNLFINFSKPNCVGLSSFISVKLTEIDLPC